VEQETVSATGIWRDAQRHLATTLSSDIYERWIAVIDSHELRDDTLVLSVANDFYQTWLIENYLPLIEQAVTAAAGQGLKICFVVDRAGHRGLEEPKEEAEPAPAPARRSVVRVSPRPCLNQKYTFDRFVVGPSNSFAHAATLAVAHSPARAYNPLFLYGGSGLGKTHLMQAIGHHILDEAARDVEIWYTSTEQFTNEYIDALRHKELVRFRRKYRSADVLLVDDIHFLSGKEALQEEFFHTFNALFDSHKQIVMTCDRPASEIPGLEHRLVSRFEWGLVTELGPPDVETRIAILHKKQEQLDSLLSDEIIHFLAEHIRSNVRRLEGALIRVASYASLTGRKLDLNTLEELLRDTLDQEQQQAVTMESIQKAVADYYDIRLGDMTSKRRPQSIAHPRQIAMYLCRTMTQHSLPEIGTAFGRNHATVLHACRSVTQRITDDPALRKTVTVIRQRLVQR
jgi:chromosomal replication initiator protein